MSSRARGFFRVASGACCLVCFAACEAIVGLDELTVAVSSDASVAGAGQPCSAHRDCGDLAAQYRCVPGEQRCAALRTDACSPIAGPDEDPHAIWIGLLLSTSGPHASANLARQQGAVLAVEALNAAGGVRLADPSSGGPAQPHPLVLVACDASRDALGAGKHLAVELGIRAIIGPDDSQDAVQLATKLAIPNDVLLVNPIASTANFADLLDDDLSWGMVPNDTDRLPWFVHQARALESVVAKDRGRSDLKLAIALRDDVQGYSKRPALGALSFGGKPLAEPENLGEHVRVDAYATDRGDLSELVDAYLAFRPDLVLLFGMSEAITRILTPLEERWAAVHPDYPPPEYLLTDAAKVPELIELGAQRDELRSRIRGLGATQPPASDRVHEAFASAYRQRFSSEVTEVSGLAATYDATHAVALAIASSGSLPSSGRELARALRRVSNGSRRMALERGELGPALAAAATGDALSIIGAFGPLRWDERGAAIDGALEVWCVGRSEGLTNFASSGFRVSTLDVPRAGEFGTCEREGVRTSPAPTTTRNLAPDAGGAGPHAPMAPMEPPAVEPVPPSTVGPDAGTAGEPADAGGEVAPPTAAPAAVIPCGASACVVASGDYCCVSTVRGATEDPLPEDFACTSSSGVECALTLHCTSDSDCGGGSICCGMNNTTECVDEAECAERAGSRLSCETSRDCAGGQICCAQLAPAVSGYANVGCRDECSFQAGQLTLCESDADCAFALSSCRPSRIVPNLKMCNVL